MLRFLSVATPVTPSGGAVLGGPLLPQRWCESWGCVCTWRAPSTSRAAPSQGAGIAQRVLPLRRGTGNALAGVPGQRAPNTLVPALSPSCPSQLSPCAEQLRADPAEGPCWPRAGPAAGAAPASGLCVAPALPRGAGWF